MIMPPAAAVRTIGLRKRKTTKPTVEPVKLYGKEEIKQLERERAEQAKAETKKKEDAALENKYHLLVNRLALRDGRIKALEALLKAKKEKKKISEKLLNAMKWVFVGFNFLRFEWPKNLILNNDPKTTRLKEWEKIWKERRQRVFGFSIGDVQELLKKEREELEKDQQEFKKITS